MFGFFKPNVGKMEKKKDVQGLIKALAHEDVNVALEVVGALAKIGDTAVGPLIEALRDEYWHTREMAAIALGEIGDPRAVGPLIQAVREGCVRSGAATALGQIGGAAVEPLIRALKDEDVGVRLIAASALGDTRDARAAEPLNQALKDEDGNVRRAARESLGKIRSKKT